MSVLRNLKSLASDSLVYGVAGVITRFLGILLTPLYTRVYDPEDYGIFGLINNGYALITIILIFALDNSTARWFYDSKEYQKRKSVINSWLWFYFFFSLAAGVLLFFTAGVWSDLLFDGLAESITYIRLLAFNLPIVVLSVVATKILRFEKKAKHTVFLTFLQALVLILTNFFFVLLLEQGLMGAFIAKLVTSIIIAPVAFYMIKSWVGSIHYFSLKLWRQMVKYSLPFVPASVAIWIISLSGIFFLNEFVSKDEVGLFQIGFAVASFAGLITASFQQAWAPFAYSILGTENSKKTYAQVLMIYILFAGTGVLLISIFSMEALMIIATPSYYGASHVASILTFSTLFMGLTSIADLGSSIAKKTAPLGIIYSFSAVLLVGFNFLLIPRLGKEGAAIAICLSQSVTPLLVFIVSQKYYYIPYDFKKAIIVFLFMAIVAFFGSLIQFQSIVVTVLAKIILLGFFVLGLFLFFKTEFMVILNHFKVRFIKNTLS